MGGKIKTTPNISRIMAGVKGKNTKPEILVRKLLYSMGYRYRIHCKDLPGTPDLVLSKYKTVIHIRGCFWHYHEGCKTAHYPKSNADYWAKKINKNISRDNQNVDDLIKLGWNVIIIWECQTKDLKSLAEILKHRLEQFKP
jgi:DNA mismatch endonuclease (patch repair protein)